MRPDDSTREELLEDAQAYWRVVEKLWPYWERQPSMPAEEAVERLVRYWVERNSDGRYTLTTEGDVVPDEDHCF